MSKKSFSALQSSLKGQKRDFRLSKVLLNVKKEFFSSPKCFGMSKKRFSALQSALECQKRVFRLSKVFWKIKKEFFAFPKCFGEVNTLENRFY